MAKCEPPKSVFVRAYERLVGRRKRKRKAPTPKAGPYWTCVQARTGKTCGTRHQTATAALRHSKRLDREERARSARFSTSRKRVKVNQWDPEHRG